jgi:prephenate dehydrogenase
VSTVPDYSAGTVVVMGLGLIGGSLARALRRSGFSRRFVGYGHQRESLEEGLALGVIDEFTLDLDEAMAQADLLVLAAPTLVAERLLLEVLPRLSQRERPPVITDVASVKGNLLRAAKSVWGGRIPPNLVLGHPIAGSERSGVAASSALLFHGHRVILTPVEGNDETAVELVRAMWASTGAEVVELGVAEHDAVLAATSHLPHVLAYALVDTLARSELSEDIFRFAAGGFRDFTRIASSDPVMWRDIAVANRDALLASIDEFSLQLGGLREAVAGQKSEQLLQIFIRAKAARDRFTVELAARGESSAVDEVH